MSRLLLTCFLGALIGAAITRASHSLWHPEDGAQPTRNGKDQLAVAARTIDQDRSHSDQESSQEDARNTARTRDGGTPVPDRESVEDSAIVDDQENLQNGPPVDSLGRELPDTYAPLVKPPPKRTTPQDLYERFLEDERDEAWAYGMELGINQFIADHGAESGARFDFVGCRGQYCMLAGALYGGGQSDYNEIVTEMSRSGWWQASGGNFTSAYSTDSEYRFVTILPRTNEQASLTD